MYTICSSSRETIAGNYEKWLERHKGNGVLVRKVRSLLDAAIAEACTCDDVRDQDPLNDLIRHMDQLACFSLEWQGGFCINAPCTDTRQMSYYRLISSNCIHCVLFSLLFRGTDTVLLLEPGYVNEFRWDSLRDVLPFTDLKHIAVEAEDYLKKSEPENPPGKVVGKLWFAESDQCCAVVQERGIPYEETEDGYPIEIAVYNERFCPMAETKTMAATKRKWLSWPKLSSEKACAGFLQKRERCMARIQKNKIR